MSKIAIDEHDLEALVSAALSEVTDEASYAAAKRAQGVLASLGPEGLESAILKGLEDDDEIQRYAMPGWLRRRIAKVAARTATAWRNDNGETD